MARFRVTAMYRGKGQKALPERIEKLLAAGVVFDSPRIRAGREQVIICDYDERPVLRLPNGDSVNSNRLVGLRKAVGAAEKACRLNHSY